MPEAEQHVKHKKTKEKIKEQEFIAVGRRKTAVARVHLTRGQGSIVINGKSHDDYVSGRHVLITHILKPFLITNLGSLYNANIKASGGGIASQAEAVKLGIARALILIDPTLKGVLGKAGCLVRDPRMKERKKYGQKKARKRFQYSKR